MNEYIIIKTNLKDYDKLVLCLTFESLLSYIQKIENSLSKDNNSDEKILIDQLLITGNGQNRFISLKFTHGKLDLKTAEIVNPNDHYRKETIEWLHNNYLYAENSILTNTQKQKIKDNIVF